MFRLVFKADFYSQKMKSWRIFLNGNKQDVIFDGCECFLALGVCCKCSCLIRHRSTHNKMFTQHVSWLTIIHESS